MIQQMSHATVYVLDQEKALEFYRDKLGFEVRQDFSMEGGFRWLTVGPAGQPDLQLILAAVSAGPMMDEETARSMASMVAQGAFGIGVFKTADCKATYADLVEKGVEFTVPPTDRFYGIEALGKDDSGNWFSLTQQKPFE